GLCLGTLADRLGVVEAEWNLSWGFRDLPDEALNWPRRFPCHFLENLSRVVRTNAAICKCPGDLDLAILLRNLPYNLDCCVTRNLPLWNFLSALGRRRDKSLELWGEVTRCLNPAVDRRP